MRSAALSLLVLCACGGTTITDAGVKDAGMTADAGQDAGPDDAGNVTDGGSTVCDGGVLIDGSGDGYRAPPASDDGVVGVPSTVWRLAQQWPYPGAPPEPLVCIHAVVIGPSAQVVSSTVTADATTPHLVTATFVPPVAGTYHVTLTVAHGDSFQDDVTVYDSDPPDLMLPRGCGSVVSAAGYVGCDETLFARDGSVVTTLDGGLWLSMGTELLAYQNGGLGFATVDDGGVSFGPMALAPEPYSWSSYGSTLALTSRISSGGWVYESDAGTLTATGSLPFGWVDVLSNGTVLMLDVNEWYSTYGLLYGANADQLVSWVGLNTINGGNLGCFGPDAGFASPVACAMPPSPQYYDQVNAWRLPRRPLGLTTQGVRLPGTGAMYLSGANQVTDGDDFVWESSVNQTAIWFR
jgi:hypothetical protein